jgi:hypothetical protein
VIGGKNQGAAAPTALGSMLQASTYGQTIPSIYGSTQSALLAIWAANLRMGSSGPGAPKKLKQLKKGIPNYIENIDFLLGHSPIMGILNVMVNGGLYFPFTQTEHTFEAATSGNQFTVPPPGSGGPGLYIPIAVTIDQPFSFSFDDFGGQGPVTGSGTWEVPCWNALENGPDPTDNSATRNWPFVYRWGPSGGPYADSIFIDSYESNFGGDATVNLYFAPLKLDNGNIGPPMIELSLAFEAQLGSGDEYADANLSGQQIIYPHFAGAGSSEFNLGASGAIPQVQPEVRGKWGLYSTGDGDFADMIEDIFKSGLAQAAIGADVNYTQMERGLSGYSLPGAVQKKVLGTPSALSGSATAFPSAVAPTANPGDNSATGTATGSAPGTGVLTFDQSGPLEDSFAQIVWSGFVVPGGIPDGAVITSITANASANSPGAVNGGEGGIFVEELGDFLAFSSEAFDVNGTGGGGTDLSTSAVTAHVTSSLGPNTDIGQVINITSVTLAVNFSVPGTAGVGYDRPVTKGNFLVVQAFAGSGFSISDNLSNEWTPIFAAGQNYQAWYATANASGACSVDVVGALDSSEIAIFEIAGVDTFDAVVTATTGPATITTSVQQGFSEYLFSLATSATLNAQPLPGGWDVSLPQNNMHGQFSPNIHGLERVTRSPGTFTLQAPNTAEDTAYFVIAFKATTPSSFPLPVGDYLDIDSLDQVRLQCRANGLFGALTMNSQQSAADWLKTLYQAANASPVYLGFKLFSYPMSEVSAAANGAIYNAPTATGPIASLDANNGDFVGTDPPIKFTGANRIDLPNVLQMQYISREANYVQTVAAQPESGSIALYGVRKADPIVNNAVQSASVALQLLGIAVRRNQYGGDKYTFTLSAKYCLLTPMFDLILITDELADIIAQPVRMTSMAEQDDGSFSCEADPFIYGLNAPTAITTTEPTTNSNGINLTAGNVNAPVIFEATSRLASNSTQAQLWVVVSSSAANYGGCQVFVSTDGGNSYNVAGPVLTGSAVTGVTTADWPAAADPDTTNNLSLDLSESNGTLESFTGAQRDAFAFPCYVAGGGSFEILYELMTYNEATLVSANNYTLDATGTDNALRRGVFGAPSPTVGVDHPTGSRFAFLPPGGPGILAIDMDPAWIGVELFFKVCSNNSFGSAPQSLEDVTAFSYTPNGAAGATGGSSVFQVNGA